jgi:hypothetical protein
MGSAHWSFYKLLSEPSSPLAQASTSGVASSILEYAGLKQIGIKALQARLWRARSVFDETKRFADADQVLGCSPLEAVQVLGINPEILIGGVKALVSAGVLEQTLFVGQLSSEFIGT